MRMNFFKTHYIYFYYIYIYNCIYIEILKLRHQYLNMFGDTLSIRSSPPLSPSLSHLLPRVAVLDRDKNQVQSPHFVSTWNEVEIKSLSAQVVINLTASSPCLNSHYPNFIAILFPNKIISTWNARSINTRTCMIYFHQLFPPFSFNGDLPHPR